MKFKFEAFDPTSDRKRYVWSLAGENGGFHIWAQFTEASIFDGMYGGVEVHYKSKPYDHSPDEAPIKNCWLTGCDCWPDGSSLQFEEQYKELIRYEENPMNLNDYMLSELTNRYISYFGKDEEPTD